MVSYRAGSPPSATPSGSASITSSSPPGGWYKQTFRYPNIIKKKLDQIVQLLFEYSNLLLNGPLGRFIPFFFFFFFWLRRAALEVYLSVGLLVGRSVGRPCEKVTITSLPAYK